MNEASCAEVEELLPAYALSALPEEEAFGVATHLTECRRHDADLQAYRSVSSRLADLSGEVPPRGPLRNQLLQRFDEAVASEFKERPLRRDDGFWLRPSFAYALAASFLILALGLGAWGMGRGGGGQDVIVATVSQAEGSLRVVYVPGEQVAVMEIGLPPLPPNQAYQAWKVTEDGTESLGIVTNRGQVVIAADLSNAVAVALSVEPASGSATPTSTPVLVASF